MDEVAECFRGSWIVPRPSATFHFSANESGFAPVRAILSCADGCFFQVFDEESVVLPELPESDVITTALNNNATISNCSKHHDSH